jgi:hypothetical protein
MAGDERWEAREDDADALAPLPERRSCGLETEKALMLEVHAKASRASRASHIELDRGRTSDLSLKL